MWYLRRCMCVTDSPVLQVRPRWPGNGLARPRAFACQHGLPTVGESMLSLTGQTTGHCGNIMPLLRKNYLLLFHLAQVAPTRFRVDVSQSVSGTLDRPRVVAPSKTCGHVRSSGRRWRWAQCRPRSAAPTFGRVVLAGASTPAWCSVYHLCERPQPGVVRSGLVSLQVVAARDQKWRVASDKSGLLSLLRQFG